MIGSFPELNDVDDLLDGADGQGNGADELRPGELLQRRPEQQRHRVSDLERQYLHERDYG